MNITGSTLLAMVELDEVAQGVREHLDLTLEPLKIVILKNKI